MNDSRVVITGIGIVSSLGTGKEAFWESLLEGAVGVKPITLFDTSKFECKHAAEITDFSPENFIDSQGLRYLDRSTKLLLSASKFALEDRSKSINEIEDVGVVMGTAFGGLHSIGEFDRDSVVNPNYVNPMSFPNTVINSPASQVSIKYGTRKFNVTISTGYAAGLDAVCYAVNSIRLGRASTILAGGVEELSEELFAAYYYNNLLSNAGKEQTDSCIPCNSRKNGVVLGEGSAVVLVEDLKKALNDGVDILAEIVGYGTSCDADFTGSYNREATGAVNSINFALEEANLTCKNIDLIISSSNGNIEGDNMELKALKSVFGDYLEHISVCSVKSSIGECLGASGPIQVAASVLSIINGVVPPTPGYEQNDTESICVNMSSCRKNREIKNVLINSFGCNGVNTSLVIKKYIP